MRSLLALTSVVALSLTTAAARQAPAPTAADLAARVQAHYATVRDFTAGFTVNQKSTLMVKTLVERGDVKVKKPGRMRWTYKSPEEKEFVADGSQLYAYHPKDKYVMISALPPPEQSSAALLFLSGRGDLARDFTAAVPATHPDGEWRLELTPRNRQADFTTLTLDVDRATLQLRGVIVVDDNGESTFRFTNLRENQGLPDQAFVFTIPKGVERIRR
jgi:outer membrane lipoprotein carrier protein